MFVLYLDYIDSVRSTFYGDNGGVWQTFALSIASQKEIVSTAMHFKTYFYVITHYDWTHSQTVWRDWCYTKGA